MKCASSCLKINNPIRNLLFPVIIFTALEKLFGYVFYMSLFKDVWTPYVSLWRPMEEQNYWCLGMTLVSIFYALIISFLYIKLCDLAKKKICIFGFVFAVFVIGRFFGEIYNYLMFPYDPKVAFLGIAHGFFVLTFWALFSKKVFIIKN